MFWIVYHAGTGKVVFHHTLQDEAVRFASTCEPGCEYQIACIKFP